MELDSSLSWLRLTPTPGIAARLSARLLKEFGSPDEVLRAPPRRLEACNLPVPSAQDIAKKQPFQRAKVLSIPGRSSRPALAMEFGREVFGVPGDVIQPVSFAPNQLIKQSAKLVTCAEDVIEGWATPVRAALAQVMQPETSEANLLVAASLNPSEKKIYDLLQFG
jgi:predicted Rossmann fold nucleotide-binding protein DprA/Smf involved in DNA uptake